jgi:hypothetical protein
MGYRDLVRKIENPNTTQRERLALYAMEFSLVVDLSSIHEDIVKLLEEVEKTDLLRARRIKKEADSYLMTEGFDV